MTSKRPPPGPCEITPIRWRAWCLLQTSRDGDDWAREVYERLLKERIAFVGSEIEDVVADRICSHLLLLQSLDPERDVYLYINSSGGSLSAAMAIYDAMQYVSCDVGTICLGQAFGIAELLAAEDSWQGAGLDLPSPEATAPGSVKCSDLDRCVSSRAPVA